MAILQATGSPKESGFNQYTKFWHFWGHSKKYFKGVVDIFLNFNFNRVTNYDVILTYSYCNYELILEHSYYKYVY